MKVNKAKVPKNKLNTKPYIKEQDPTGSQFKRFSDAGSKHEDNYEIGCQCSWQSKNNLKYVYRCKTVHVNYYSEKRNTPKLNAEDIASSTTIIKIGSIRAATNRNVQRIHLPEVATRGVGSKPVIVSRRGSLHTCLSKIINKRVSKCLMVSLAAATLNKKLSPIHIPEHKELTFGDNYVNDKMDEAEDKIEEKNKVFGGVGDVCFPKIFLNMPQDKIKPENDQTQNIHAEDILPNMFPTAIQNKMCDIKIPNSKSPLRLFKGFGRKKDKNSKEMPESVNNEKYVRVDKEESYLKTNCLERKKLETDKYGKQSNRYMGYDVTTTDSEIQSNVENPNTPKEKSIIHEPITPMLSNDTDAVGSKNRKNATQNKGFRRFLTKHKDSQDRLKHNANLKCSFTTNRCEVKTYSDLAKAHKSKEKLYHRPRRANRGFSWLAKFMANGYDSKDDVHIRWCNQTYGQSSNTVSNLKLSLCNDPDLVFRSRSKIMSKMQHPHSNLRHDKKKSVNFLYQNIQAFMVHTIATDKPVEMLVPKNSLVISKNDKYVGVQFSEPTSLKEHTDRLLEMTDVFNSTTMIEFRNCSTRSEYIKINIPEGFLSDTTTDENTSQKAYPNNNSSTEEVCKQIVEYEALQAKSKIKNKAINLEHGDNNVDKKLKSVKSHESLKKPLTTEVEPRSFKETVVQEVILDTRNRRKMKIIGSKNYDTESHSQPSTLKTEKNCALADIYLKDYYRNWIAAESYASSCYVSEEDRNVDLENDIVFQNMGVRRSKSCSNTGKTIKCRPSSAVSTCNISNKSSIDKMIKDTLKKVVMRSLTAKYTDYVRKVDKKIEDCICGGEENLKVPKSGKRQCPNEILQPLHVMHFSSKFLTFIRNIIEEDSASDEVRTTRHGKKCPEKMSNVLTMEIKDAQNDLSSVSDYLKTSQETYLSMTPGSIKGYESISCDDSNQNPQIDINIKIDVGENMKEYNKSLSHTHIEEEGECCICSDSVEFAQSSNVESNMIKPSEYSNGVCNKNSARCSQGIRNGNVGMQCKKINKDVSRDVVRNKVNKSAHHAEKRIISNKKNEPISIDQLSCVSNKENDPSSLLLAGKKNEPFTRESSKNHKDIKHSNNVKKIPNEHYCPEMQSTSNMKLNDCNNNIEKIFSSKKSIPESLKMDAQKPHGKRILQCTPQSSHISSRELNRVDDFDTKSKTTDSEAISSKIDARAKKSVPEPIQHNSGLKYSSERMDNLVPSNMCKLDEFNSCDCSTFEIKREKVDGQSNVGPSLKNIDGDLTKAKAQTPSNNVQRKTKTEPMVIDKNKYNDKNNTEETSMPVSTKLQDTQKIESKRPTSQGVEAQRKGMNTNEPETTSLPPNVDTKQKADTQKLSSDKNIINPSLKKTAKPDDSSNKNIADKDGPDASNKTGNEPRKNVQSQDTNNNLQVSSDAQSGQNECDPINDSIASKNENSSRSEPYTKTVSGVTFINLKHFKQCECDTKGKSSTMTKPDSRPIKKDLDGSNQKVAVSPRALSLANTKRCSCDDKSLKPLFRSPDLTGPGSAPISVPNSRHASRGASPNSDIDSASYISESETSSSTSASSASKDNVKSKKHKRTKDTVRSKDRESPHNTKSSKSHSTRKKRVSKKDDEICSRGSKRGSKTRRSRSRSKRRQKIRRSDESMSDINIRRSNSKTKEDTFLLGCACCCSTKPSFTETGTPCVCITSGIPKEPKKKSDLGNTSGFNIKIIPTEEPFISNKIDIVTSKHRFKNEDTLSRSSSKYSRKTSKHRFEKVDTPSRSSSKYRLRKKDTPSWIISKTKMRKHDIPSKGFEMRRRGSKRTSRRRPYRSSSQLSDGHDDKAKGDDLHNIFNMERKQTSKPGHHACKSSVCGMCGKRLTAAPMIIESRSKDKNIYETHRNRSRFRMYRAESASATEAEEFTTRSLKRKSSEKICHSVNVGPSGSRSRIKEKSMHKSPKKNTGTTTHDSCDSDTCCVCKKKGTVKSGKKTPDMPPDCDCHNYPSKQDQEKQRKGLPIDCECEEKPPLDECECKPDPPKPKKVKQKKSKQKVDKKKSSLCECAAAKKEREKKHKEKKQKQKKEKRGSCPGGPSCCECKGGSESVSSKTSKSSKKNKSQEKNKKVKSKTSQGCLCEADKRKRDKKKKPKKEKKKKNACTEADQCCKCDGGDGKNKKEVKKKESTTCVCRSEARSKSASKTSVKKKSSKEKNKSKPARGGTCLCKKDLKNAESSCFCLPEQPDPKNPKVMYKPSCEECRLTSSNTSQLKRQPGKTDVKDKKKSDSKNKDSNKCKKYCFIKGPSKDSKSVDSQSLLCNECNQSSADDLFKGAGAGKKRRQPEVKRSGHTIRTASVHTIIRETTGSIKITPSDTNYYPKKVKVRKYKNLPPRISSSSTVLRTTAKQKPISKTYKKDTTFISTQTLPSDQDLWKRNYATTYIPTGSLKSDKSPKGSNEPCYHSQEEVHNIMSLAIAPPMYDSSNWPKRYGKARVIPTQTFGSSNKKVVSLSTTSVSKGKSRKPARMIASRGKMKKRDHVKVIVTPKPLEKIVQTEMKTSGLGQSWVDKLKVLLNPKTAESMIQTHSSAIRAQTQIVRHSLGDKLRDVMKPRTTDTIIQTKPFVIEIKHSKTSVMKMDTPKSYSHGEQQRGIFRYLSPRKVKHDKSDAKNAYSVTSILNIPIDQRNSWQSWELRELDKSHKDDPPGRQTFVKIRSQSLLDMSKVRKTIGLSINPRPKSRETKVNYLNLDETVSQMNSLGTSKKNKKVSKRHSKPVGERAKHLCYENAQFWINNQHDTSQNLDGQDYKDSDPIGFSKPSVYLATCPRFVDCDMKKIDEDDGMLKVIRLNSKETIVIGVRKQIPKQDEARNYRIYFRVSDKDGRVLVERRDWSSEDLDVSADGIEAETSVMKIESGVQAAFRNHEDTISYSNSFNETEKGTSISVNTSMVNTSFNNQKVIQASNVKKDISMVTEETAEPSKKKDVYLDRKNKTTSNHNLQYDEKIKLVDPHTTETMSVIRDMYKYQDDEKESIFKIPVKDAGISADTLSNSSVFEISLSLKVYPGNKNVPIAKVTQKQIDKPASVASELLEKIKNQSAEDIYSVNVLPDKPIHHSPSNGFNIRIVMKRNNNCITEKEKLLPKDPIAEVFTTCKNKVKSLKPPIKTNTFRFKTEKKIKPQKINSKQLNEYNYDTEASSNEDLSNGVEGKSNDKNYYFHKNVVISFVDCGRPSISDLVETDSFVAESKDSKLIQQLKDMQLVLRLSLTADAVTQLDDSDHCSAKNTDTSSQINLMKVEPNDNFEIRNTCRESRPSNTQCQLRKLKDRCSNLDDADKAPMDNDSQCVYTAFTVHQQGPLQNTNEYNDEKHKVCASAECDISPYGSEEDEENRTRRNIEVVNVCTQCSRNSRRDLPVPTFGVKAANWRAEHDIAVKKPCMQKQFRSHGRYLKLFSINKLNKSVLGISSGDEIVFLDKVPNEDLKRQNNKMRKTARAMNVFNVTADILQTNEAKKAVLELYEDTIKNENGDQIISNLPKFIG